MSGIQIFQDCVTYIESATSIKQRMARVLATKTALENQRLAMAMSGSKSQVSEYSLDDGQTKIRTVYRSMEELTKAIAGLDMELVTLQNRVNGRMTKLMDENNFNFRRGR